MSPRTLSHVVLLLSLSWIACQPGEEKDTESPADVRVVGGVTGGESVTGSRTLQATATDGSGTIARVEFAVSGRPACSDDVAKGSGETFSSGPHVDSPHPFPQHALHLEGHGL